MLGRTPTKSKKRSSQGAFGLSVLLHFIILGSFVMMNLCPPYTPLPAKRLLVSSVTLQPHIMPPPSTGVIAQAPSSPPEEPPSPKPSETVQDAPKPSEEEAPSKQSKTTAPTKPTKKTTTCPAKKKPSPSKTSPKSSNSKGVDQKILQKVLKSLDQSKTYGNGSPGTSKGGKSVRHAANVGSLAVDQGISIERIADDFADSGYGESSPEACYISDLIRRLQLNIRLPEPGEVKIKLTLKRNGAISTIDFVQCHKESTKKTIKTKLSSIMFSPFGASFSSEKEHTFSLRLTHDLIWSCG